MGDERRDSDRVEILGELQGEVMVFQGMTIKEISPTGTRVETPFPLQLDSLHEFRLTLGSQSIVLKGRVAHCQIADVEHEHVTYQSGIQFVDTSDRVRDVVNAFIDAVKVARSGA